VTQRISVVGPVFPLPGGIAQHTSRLTSELEQRGHDVTVESWSHQYPRWLYQGEIIVPSANPEAPLPSRVNRDLAWFSPVSWWRVGRRLRRSEIVVLTVPSPFHAIPYSLLTQVAGSKPCIVGIFHNPEPHESHLFDRALMKSITSWCGRIIVHNSAGEQYLRAISRVEQQIDIAALPSPWTQPRTARTASRKTGPLRLLFFGTVRPYKGLDILLEALAHSESIELVVAGDFWEPIANYEALIERFGIENRVALRPGYVPHEEFGEIFGEADALVLPYRSGSGSIVREIAFDHGVPVIATNVGSIAESVVDGENGIVVSRPTVEGLVFALETISQPETLRRLTEGATRLRRDQHAQWREYCEAITGGR